MASADSLTGLMKWLRRAEWQDAFDELLHRHLAPVCGKADVRLDELPELIGHQHFTALWGCVFEDFLARDLVRGGEPVRVSERSGTRSLKPWDRIAARVVRVGTKTEMAGGALVYD